MHSVTFSRPAPACAPRSPRCSRRDEEAGLDAGLVLPSPAGTRRTGCDSARPAAFGRGKPGGGGESERTSRRANATAASASSASSPAAASAPGWPAPGLSHILPVIEVAKRRFAAVTWPPACQALGARRAGGDVGPGGWEADLRSREPEDPQQVIPVWAEAGAWRRRLPPGHGGNVIRRLTWLVTRKAQPASAQLSTRITRLTSRMCNMYAFLGLSFTQIQLRIRSLTLSLTVKSRLHSVTPSLEAFFSVYTLRPEH